MPQAILLKRLRLIAANWAAARIDQWHAHELAIRRSRPDEARKQQSHYLQLFRMLNRFARRTGPLEENEPRASAVTCYSQTPTNKPALPEIGNFGEPIVMIFIRPNFVSPATP